MGWDVTQEGLKAIFSRDIPELVTTKLHDVAVAFLAEHGLTLRDIDSLRLPSRRRESARRARGGVRTRAGNARDVARRAARLRQHVGRDGDVRPGAHASATRSPGGARWSARSVRASPPDSRCSRTASERTLDRSRARRAAARRRAVLFRAQHAPAACERRRRGRLGAVSVHRAAARGVARQHGRTDSAVDPPNWWLLGVYAALQPLRVWTMATLGPYWTTRIVSVPGAPLVRTALSLRAASQLRRRLRRDRPSPAGFRRGRDRDRLLDSQRVAALVAHPRGRTHAQFAPAASNRSQRVTVRLA